MRSVHRLGEYFSSEIGRIRVPKEDLGILLTGTSDFSAPDYYYLRDPVKFAYKNRVRSSEEKMAGFALFRRHRQGTFYHVPQLGTFFNEIPLE